MARPFTSFMHHALDQARQAATKGEVPIGAVIVQEGKVIASAHNEVESALRPFGHAELIAIERACQTLQTPRLPDCDLYVTLEPCPMCAQAISFARLRRLYWGAPDPKGGGVEHGPRIFGQPTCHHKPEIYGNIEEQACGNLLRDFFAKRR